MSSGGRHRRGRHRRVDPPRIPVAGLILTAGWLALVSAPTTQGAAVFNPGIPPRVAVLTQPTLRPAPSRRPVVAMAAAVTQRIPPLVGAVGLKPNAVVLASYLQQHYPGLSSIGGVRPDALPDHPSGHALDAMVGADSALGDRVLQDMVAHTADLHIRYVIWQQTIYYPSGRHYLMADRGSRTANHYDHVHISVF